ncbi:MAG: response regulator [Xanthobacteraceae bacterium]
MSSDLISLKVLIVMRSASERELLRQGAGLATVPAEVVEADGAANAKALLAGAGIDLVLLDAGLPAADKAIVCAAARAAGGKPFIVGIGREGELADVDGRVNKPATADEAQATVDCCIRTRIPARVLVVDDSPTMRAIVRKILTASKFPLEIVEVDEGIKALKQLKEGSFDIVFLDYNMPGLNGFETLSELRREHPHVVAVMISSTDKEDFADQARQAGAAAFLKKPFFPADIDAVLYRYYQIEAPPRAR